MPGTIVPNRQSAIGFVHFDLERSDVTKRRIYFVAAKFSNVIASWALTFRVSGLLVA